MDGFEIAPGVRLALGPAKPVGKGAIGIAVHSDRAVSLGALSLMQGGDAEVPATTQVTLLATSEALAHLGADLSSAAGMFLLPPRLREVVTALLNPTVLVEARGVYQAAKGLELLCEVLRLNAAGELLPLARDGALSAADTQRVVAASRLIDERCAEKLTLEAIARSCGLNRSKLTKGFRELFGCSVAEAIAQRRLEHASRMLIYTDMPVSSVGYRAGYLNNASFARAFGRRFGRTPSDFRAQVMAA